MPLENEPVPPSTGPSPAYVETTVLESPSIPPGTAIYPTQNYANSTTPFWATAGSGGSAVNQVTAGSGLVVSPTTGNVVVSMPAVGTAGAVSNPASITTDAQGRVTAATSLGYTPVAPSALSAYAPLAGATFTGPVSGTTFTGSGQVQGNTVVATNGLTVNAGTADMKLATTVQVPTPTLPASAATKAYVDSQIPSVTGFAQLNAPNTFTADNDFTGAATNVTIGESAVAPIDTFQVWAKDVNLRNTDATNVFNLTSAGLMSVSAAAGLTVNANAAVNMTASIGNASVYSVLGDVNIGGNVNHVTITGNDVNTNGGDIQTGAGVITAGEVNISNGTNTGNVLDSQFNPPTLANAITTKGIRNSFKDQNGNTVYSATLDTTPNLQVVGVWTFAGNTKFNMNTAPNQPALFYNTINTFRLTSSGLSPNTGVVLPASPPDGTMVGVFNANDSPGGNFGIFLPDGSTLLKSGVTPGSGFYCQFLGSTWYAEQSIGSFIPLAGTAENAPVTGPVVFDNAANLQCLDIQTGLISALPAVEFISVTDPMQTKLLGVRSSDPVNAPATILMALSETAAPADTCSLRYAPAPLGTDELQTNKGIRVIGGGDITTDGNLTANRIDYGLDGLHGTGAITALGDITGALVTANSGINTTTLTTNGQADIQGALNVTLGDLTVQTGHYAKCATVPLADEDLTNKLYVDSAIAGAGPFLPLAGGTMSGAINMGGNAITNATSVATSGDITTVSGNIGSGSGDIGTLTGSIAAPAGTVSGLQIVAGDNGITTQGPLNMNPTGVNPQNIAGALGIVASQIIQGGALLATDTGNAVGSASIALKTDDPAFASEDGTVASITFPDPTAQNAVLYARGPLSLVDPPNGGAPAAIIINGVPQTLNGSDWSTYAATQNVDMAGFAIQNAGNILAASINTTGTIDADTTISALDMVATDSMTAATVTANTGLFVNGVDVGATIAFKPNATLYVAKNGNDTTGNGSMLQPYLTIQKAYTVAAGLSSSGNIYAINIAAGHYTENLSLTGRTYVWFVGAVAQGTLGGVGETTEIVGDITINANVPGGDDLYNKVCGFINLQITGSITVNSINESSLVIKDCKMYAADRAIYVNAAATDYRTYIYNTSIQHQSAGVATNALVEITKGWLYATGGNWTALNNSSVLAISGTGTAIQVGQVVMESDSSSATLAPIVSITTTSTTTNTFGQCSMIAISATAKTTPAILINSATPPTMNLLQNYFGISGTTAAGNVIQWATAAPTLQIGGNNSQYGTSAQIQSGITSVPTQNVGLASFGPLAATSGTIASTTMTGNTLTVTGTGQGVACATVTNGATILNGRVNITGSASSVALTVNTGSAASNTVELNGGTINTSGANGMKLAPAAISCVNNNVAMSGINSITMAGTTPTISGVNSLTITNTNGTVPLTINNNTDNPTMVMGITPASTTIPLEFQFNNNIISAFGNQNTSTRGSVFIYTNSKDCFRALSANARVLMNYSPYSPTLATSGAAGAWVAGSSTAWVSGVPKLLGTETITLTSNNLPIIEGGFGTPCYIGVNGYINTCVLNAAHEFVITATYTRTRSGVTVGPYALYGCSYPTTSQSGGAFTSPLNGTTYNEAVVGERTTFTLGDVLAIQVYGTYTGGSPPSTVTAPTGLAAVFSPFFI